MQYDPERKAIAYPWHGYEFDIDSGRHRTSSRYRFPTYPIEVADGNVYVHIS